jgi:molybdopterin-synthase adenylyltransferase
MASRSCRPRSLVAPTGPRTSLKSGRITRDSILGVGALVVVDPDRIDQSNLSRVVGAEAQDADRSLPKTEVVARYARRVGYSGRLETIQGSIVDDLVARSVADTDLVFGCTDNHWSGLVLNEIAHQYLVPVIDTGVELQAHGTMGGRVAILGPGAGCLWCFGMLDANRVRAEQLERPTYEMQRRHGYVPDLDVPAPAVVSVNGVVASLAVTEMLGRITGFRGAGEPAMMLAYRLSDGSVRRIGSRSGGCHTCTGPTVAAGDLAKLPTREGAESRSEELLDGKSTAVGRVSNRS